MSACRTCEGTGATWCCPTHGATAACPCARLLPEECCDCLGAGGYCGQCGEPEPGGAPYLCRECAEWTAQGEDEERSEAQTREEIHE